MDKRASSKPLEGETILVTGAARRLGRSMSQAIAQAGGNVIIHYNSSRSEAESLAESIRAVGSKAWLVRADLSSEKDILRLCGEAFSLTSVTGLINNASIFQNSSFSETTLTAWQQHLQLNLTAPFLMSQAFANALRSASKGKIINMLDWRSLRPGADHFAYTVSKAALASMTKSLALSLAPLIAVNAVALGAILPPENESQDTKILGKVPLKRWAHLDELQNVIIYLLQFPASLTGQVIHLDGGRHLIH